MSMRTVIFLFCVLIGAFVVLIAAEASAAWLAAAAAMTGMGFRVRDAKLEQSKALPDGADTTITDGIDLENGEVADFVADCELVLRSPELSAAQLPDGQDITYQIFHADKDDFDDEEKLCDLLAVEGEAAGAKEARIRFPTNVKRYVRAKAVKTGAANASAASFSIALQF